jgi:hypothetical protein
VHGLNSMQLHEMLKAALKSRLQILSCYRRKATQVQRKGNRT